MMKPFVSLIVVIPLGPACQLPFITDTLNSLRYYIRSDYRVILADDSQKGTGAALKQIFPEVDVVTTNQPMGKLCGLYITLSMAFRHALSRYCFEALLRMDTDALLIGHAPEEGALELFRREPGIGMAGQYGLDYEGKPWDISWPRNQLRKYLMSYKFLKHPKAHAQLLGLYLKARRKNYIMGESVFGGACFFSEGCLQRLQAMNLLPCEDFHVLNLEEDHLFSLLVKAAGFELAPLCGEGQPVACAWIGLPASPEELHREGKKIIHSTRHWKERGEEEIRAFFREKRTAVKEKATLKKNKSYPA